MTDYEMKPMGSAHVREDAAPPTNGKSSQTGVRRLFSFTQMYFFALSYMNSWEAMFANMGLLFFNGGPRAMVWGFFIIIPGVLAQVASLSEMSSVQPIAGAQYHWTWHLAPLQHRRFITWMQGWITWFSWIALLAGAINIAANITTTLVSVNYPTYTLEPWHTILLMGGFLIALGLINVYAFWSVPWVEFMAGILHITLWIVFIAVLLVMAPRHSANFVFLEKANESGWESDFVSFNLAIILITWGFVGFDATAHIAEETRKARTSIPRAMFWSICMNAALAFVMVIVTIFCLGDIGPVKVATVPLVPVFTQATGSVAVASGMAGLVLAAVFLVTIGSVASTSRLTWAWARDGALPSYLAYVDPKRRIPVRSVWLPIAIVMLISLLNLANAAAFGVIISLSTFGLYQSYFIAIACMLHARLTGRIDTAPWSLGRWGVPINVFALIYSAWLGVFMVFPTYLPVTAAEMNYALPINALVWIFAIAWWFCWGKKHWQGLDGAIIDKVVADGNRDTKD